MRQVINFDSDIYRYVCIACLSSEKFDIHPDSRSQDKPVQTLNWCVPNSVDVEVEIPDN